MIFHFKNVTDSLSPGQPLFNVSAALEEHQLLAVRGPSGAGKTTLLRILARLQSSGSGEAFLKGQSWQTVPGMSWRANVHYLAQRPVIFDGTVRDNLEKPFELKSMKSKRLNLDQAKVYLESLLLNSAVLEQDARTLSGGEAARVAFVRALMLEPTILLLDEPTAALDNKACEAFYETLQTWLNGEGRAAMLVSHTEDYRDIKNLIFLDIQK